MDFQDAPELTISDEERKEHEEFVRKIMLRNDHNADEWRENLRKHGYSEEDIENLMAF